MALQTVRRSPRPASRRRRRGQAAVEYVIITLMAMAILLNLTRLMTKTQASTYTKVNLTFAYPYWNTPTLSKAFANLVPSAWFNDYVGIEKFKEWLGGLSSSPSSCPGGDS